MKILLIISIAIIVYSCSNSAATKTKVTHDSKPMLVIALYDTGMGKPFFVIGNIYRSIHDTLKFVSVDESTQKKALVSDTSYFVPVKDSTRIVWLKIDNHRIVVDGGRIDSAIMRYKQN